MVTLLIMQVALSTDWQHAIILTNAGLLLIGPLGTNFVLSLGLQGLYRVTNCISSIGYFFRPLLRGRCKMAALPLPAAILDDLISGSANEVIQDGRRKRKGRHFAPPPQ